MHLILCEKETTAMFMILMTMISCSSPLITVFDWMPALYSLFAYWLFITDSKKPPISAAVSDQWKVTDRFTACTEAMTPALWHVLVGGINVLRRRGEASRGDGRLRRLTGRAIVNAAEPVVSRARPLTRQSIDLPTSCKHAECSRSPC